MLNRVLDTQPLLPATRSRTQEVDGVIRTHSYCGMEGVSEFAKCDTFVDCFESNDNLYDWAVCMENQVLWRAPTAGCTLNSCRSCGGKGRPSQSAQFKTKTNKKKRSHNVFLPLTPRAGLRLVGRALCVREAAAFCLFAQFLCAAVP